MHIDFFLERFRSNPTNEAMIWRDKIYTYRDMLTYVEDDLTKLRKKITTPMVVSIEADFSPHAASLLLALIELNCIIVPLTESVTHKKDEFKDIAQVEATIKIDRDDTFS